MRVMMQTEVERDSHGLRVYGHMGLACAHRVCVFSWASLP